MEKPKVSVYKHIDILGVLKWCNKIRPGLEKRVWNYIAESNDITNDTSIYVNFNIDSDSDLTAVLKEDYALIVEQFPEVLEDYFLFDICW